MHVWVRYLFSYSYSYSDGGGLGDNSHLSNYNSEDSDQHANGLCQEKKCVFGTDGISKGQNQLGKPCNQIRMFVLHHSAVSNNSVSRQWRPNCPGWSVFSLSSGSESSVCMVLHKSALPASILRKSISGRHRPVSYPDGPMTARYRFT